MSIDTTGRGMNKSETSKFSTSMGNVLHPSTALQATASLQCTPHSTSRARLTTLSFRASARVQNAKLGQSLSSSKTTAF